MGMAHSCLHPPGTVRPDRAPDPLPVLDRLQEHPSLLSKPGGSLGMFLLGGVETWIHQACEKKQVEVVEGMLEFLRTSSDVVVRQALKPYCRRQGLPLPGTPAEGLLLAVSMVNGKGQTPLMLACHSGCPELAKLLLAQGADPWAVDRCGGRTALHYAATSGSVACIAALMQQAQPGQAERPGSRYVDARTASGMAPLHYAAYADHPEAARELLRHDPQLAAATSYETYETWPIFEALSTPLHVAAAKGSARVVRELLRAYDARQRSGAALIDPRQARDSAGKQPWQVAAAQYPALRQLALILHPAQPLLVVLRDSPSALGGEGMGPPALAAIAVGVLRQKLVAAVEAAAAEGRRAKEAGAREGGAGGGARRVAGQAWGSGGAQDVGAEEGGEAGGEAAHPFGVEDAAAPSAAEAEAMVESELAAMVRAHAASTPDASTAGGGAGCGASGRGGTAGCGAAGGVGGDVIASPVSPVALAGVASFREGERLAAGLSPRCPTSPPRGPSGLLAVAAAAAPGGRPAAPASCCAATEEEEGGDEEAGVCGLCFERQEEVAPSGCGHGLCASCATQLCRTLRKKPLLCPFCRGPVEDFVPVALLAA